MSPSPHGQVVVEDPLQGELTREYALHLPAHYDMANTRPTPLPLTLAATYPSDPALVAQGIRVS